MMMLLPRLSTHLTFLLAISCSFAQVSDGNKPLTVIPFEMDGAHILVYGSINGSEKIPFTFDTGGSSALVDTEVADKIGLKSSGTTQGLGASGPVEFTYSTGNTLTIGDLEFRQSLFVLTSLSRMREMGAKTYGVLGYQEISKYVVKIDYDKNQLLFYDQKTYQYNGTGMKIPIGLELQIPSVTAKVQLTNGTEISGRFLIDTGAALYGSMSTPAVVKNKAIESLEKSYEIEANGASGSFTMVSGRIDYLSLGNEKFEEVPFTFNTTTSGALSDPNYVGIIGNRIMKRFNIILDYSNRKMILEPNSFYNEEYKVNASGILTTRDDEGNLKVKSIVTGSPADGIGIKKDDIIIKVNNIKAITKNRSAIRELFEEDGKKVMIEWERNGQQYSAELTLKNVI